MSRNAAIMLSTSLLVCFQSFNFTKILKYGGTDKKWRKVSSRILAIFNIHTSTTRNKGKISSNRYYENTVLHLRKKRLFDLSDVCFFRLLCVLWRPTSLKRRYSDLWRPLPSFWITIYKQWFSGFRYSV